MIDIVQAESTAGVSSAAELIREYTTWAMTLHTDSADAPTFQGLEAELQTLPGIYAPPAGRILLALVDGNPAGCVCLKPLSETDGELKRLYVRPKFRSLGLGRRLVKRLVEDAREIGYRRIELNSHITMKGAHAIYQEVGFGFVDQPADFPEQFKPFVVFMECNLGSS